MKANKLIALFVTSASLVSCSFGQLNSVTSTLSSATTNTSTTNPLSSPTSSTDSSTDSTPTSKPDTSSPTSSTDSTPNTSSPDSTPNTSSPDSTPNTSSPDSTPNTSSPDSTPNSTTPTTPTPPTPSINPHEYVWVDSFELPAGYTEYSNNIKPNSDKEIEFKDRTRTYQVGDDNRFNIKPVITFMDMSDEEHDYPNIPEPADYQYNITLQIKDAGDTYTDVTNTTTYIEDFETHTCDIDFTEAAVGKTFKVTLTPELSNSQKADPEEHTDDMKNEMIFEIVDGYNVYDIIDLSYMNNDPSIEQVWKDYRVDNGREEVLDVTPSTYILHTNLDIDNTNIPDYYFYKSTDDVAIANTSIIGSFKDFEYDQDHNNHARIGSIFTHQFDTTSNEESLKVLGNYFTISVERLPLIKYDFNKNYAGSTTAAVSHNQLFYVETTNRSVEDKKTFVLQDMKFIGNANKSAEDTSLGGGLIASKSRVKTEIRNTIQRAFYISFFNEGAQAEYLIKDSRAYDSFNCFVYNYGGNNTKIVNSEMIGAGGPVIIQDHSHLDNVNLNDGKGFVGCTVVDTASKLESYVAGTEGWFTVFATGASAMAGQIKTLDTNLFRPYGYTFCRDLSDKSDKLFNLIAVNKSGSAEGVTTDLRVKGRIQIGENNFDYGNYDGSSNTTLATYMDAVLKKSGNNVVFYTQAGGYAYTDYQGFYGYKEDLTTPSAVMPGDKIFSGEYLNLYVYGMSVVFGGYGPYSA